MSEKIIPRLEQIESSEKLVTDAHTESHRSVQHEQAERARQEKSAENVAKIHELAKAEAQNSKDIATNQLAENESDSLVGVHQSLKANAYDRTLHKVQKKMPATTRAFSKVVHNPVIENISDIGAKTVARPSGLLGGGLVAFLGSLVFVYYSKHYGFKYNFLLMIILFVTGYALGSALELLVWLVHTRKQHY